MGAPLQKKLQNPRVRDSEVLDFHGRRRLISKYKSGPGDVEARQPAEVEGGMCKLSLFAQDMF
jgi:hypothetical protein